MKPDRYGIAAKVLFGIGVVMIVLLPMYWSLRGLGIIGFLLCLPLLAAMTSRLLVNHGGSVFGWFRDRELEKWHGVHYQFGIWQVRIYEDEDRLWFVALDVAEALGWKDLPHSFLVAHKRLLRPVPGTRLQALDIAGLEVLLGSRREVDCGRFLRWARNEVVVPWERKRDDRLRPPPTPG